MRRRLASFALTFDLVLGGVAHAAAPYGRTPDGKPLHALGDSTTRAVVLFFVATDCPVSSRTFPEMRRLREAYASRKVRFWFVYPNSGETMQAVVAHQRAFDPSGQALLDPDGALTRLSGAKATPEAILLLPSHTVPAQWTPVFAGRIDDRYVRLGLERPQASRHFAERAIEAVLAGQPVAPPIGEVVGCAIARSGPAPAHRPQ